MCLLFRLVRRHSLVRTFALNFKFTLLSLVAEIVEIELDVLRNNILRFELLLSISAFMVTLGALVTGKLGNLFCVWSNCDWMFLTFHVFMPSGATVGLCDDKFHQRRLVFFFPGQLPLF